MSKVRINDLARELEVKSRPILDALEAIGITGKTHSSSIEADQAEKVRDYFNGGSRSVSAARPAADTKPKFDLSKVSKPGDALKAILERKQAEAAIKAAPPRPAAVVAPPSTAPAAGTPPARRNSAFFSNALDSVPRNTDCAPPHRSACPGREQILLPRHRLQPSPPSLLLVRSLRSHRSLRLQRIRPHQLPIRQIVPWSQPHRLPLLQARQSLPRHRLRLQS